MKSIYRNEQSKKAVWSCMTDWKNAKTAFFICEAGRFALQSNAGSAGKRRSVP